jgi:hypothetical protein
VEKYTSRRNKGKVLGAKRRNQQIILSVSNKRHVEQIKLSIQGMTFTYVDRMEEVLQKRWTSGHSKTLKLKGC